MTLKDAMDLSQDYVMMMPMMVIVVVNFGTISIIFR